MAAGIKFEATHSIEGGVTRSLCIASQIPVLGVAGSSPTLHP